MKATRFLNIFILSSLVTIGACTEEETGDEGVVTTLRASIEQKAETKTHLSGPENNIYKTLWSEDDAIGVFASGVNPSEFKLTGGAGTNSGSSPGQYLPERKSPCIRFRSVKASMSQEFLLSCQKNRLTRRETSQTEHTRWWRPVEKALCISRTFALC